MFELGIAMKLLWAILGLDIAAILLKMKLTRKTKLATAELGTKQDIKDLLGNDGLHISKNIRLSEKQCNGHVVVFAPTRAGKTTSIFIPNLLENNLRGSIIVPDPKGEIYKLTAEYQKSIGRRVIQYKPLDGKIHYNPLKECRNEREVKALGQSLLINGALSFELQTGKKAQGIEWIQMATSLLNAALLHLYPIGTITEALFLILSHTNEELDQIFTKSKSSARVQYMLFKSSMESPATMSSIKNTLASNMQLFTDQLAINKSDFNIDDFREKETILYISYPENKAIYLSPLMGCVYSQIIDHLIDDYKENCLPIWVLADEFANQGQWSSFSVNIATAGSRHVNFVLCLQSSTQLKQIYGDNYLGILNNCNTKIVLPGISDEATLKWIMTLCGNEQVNIKKAKDIMRTTKKLSDESETRRIETAHELILITNRQPIIDEQNIYYLQKKYINNVMEG